jgi:hypothetical protein
LKDVKKYLKNKEGTRLRQNCAIQIHCGAVETGAQAYKTLQSHRCYASSKQQAKVKG